MAGLASKPLIASHAAIRAGAPRAMRDLVAPLVVAVVIRFALVALVPVVPGWDGVLYLRGAEQLAEGRGYTQQMLDQSAPPKASAFFPPGMPAIFASLRMLGFGPRADLPLQALAGAFLVVIAWALGRRLGGRRAGRVAAWLVALYPGGVLLSVSYFAEPIFAFGIGIGLIPLLYSRRRNLLRWLMVMGLCFGLMAYVRSTSLIMVPIVAASVTWLRFRSTAFPQRLRKTAAWTLLAMACALAPLLPWVVRNQRALGEPVLVSTNGGLNLLLGTFGEGGYDSVPAGQNAPIGLRELEADRWRNQRARERIAADLPSWLARGALKLVNTFGYEQAPAQYVAQVNRLAPRTGERFSLFAIAACRVYWMILISLVFVGAARRIASWRHAPMGRSELIALAPVLGLALLHFVYIGGDRYHAAVVPMLAALAALGAATIFPRRPAPGQRAA